ncbi:MAG: SRPBCC family protein [Streptosporangiaceae bacterium]|jgi:uncharacterized protein YndB with AHSA1/START domain
MIDVAHQINAVRRQVGTRTLEAGEARTVVVSQVYDAAVEDVWDACTSADRIARWFLPVSGDLELGGRYQLEGNAGGTIERCDPPKSFFVTWEFGGQASWVEVRLTAEGTARTRLEIEHIAHVGDDMWAQFGPGAVGIGWDSIFLGLSQHLSRAPAVDPSNSAAWIASAEGKQFMTLSGERWREAHVASGADETQAREMAARVIAAYTGAPS